MRRTLVLLALLALVPHGVACSSFKNVDTAADAGAGDATPLDGGLVDASAADSPPGDGAPARDGNVADVASADAPSSEGGSACSGDGGCPVEVLVDNLNQASLILVDSTSIYFADPGAPGSAVYQCPKTGCATPITLGPGYATGMGVDSANVYWNDFSAGSVVACTLGGCGGQPKVLASSQSSLEGVTFDGTNLSWSTLGNIVTCKPPACSPVVTLATGQGAGIPPLASDTGTVYWSSTGGGGSVESCGAAGCGGMPHQVATGLATSVYVKNGFVFFTLGNSVVSCPVTGCGASPFTIGSSLQPFAVISDGAFVYWLDDIDFNVYRCPVTGCGSSPSIFATMQMTAPGADIALDADYAYWTASSQVLRKHK
jgi:hypothetical protein